MDNRRLVLNPARTAGIKMPDPFRFTTRDFQHPAVPKVPIFELEISAKIFDLDYSPGRSAPGSTPAPAPNLGQPSMPPRGGYGGGRGGGPSTHSMMRGHRQGPR